MGSDFSVRRTAKTDQTRTISDELDLEQSRLAGYWGAWFSAAVNALV